MANIARAYGLASTAEARSLYDEWAATFDEEMASASQDYVAPAIATKCLVDSLKSQNLTDIKILDAGCGTGLVGAHLAKLGAKHIDGVDLSPGMLEVARQTGNYKSLKTADLSQPLDCPSNTYQVVMCIGTLTQGHVGPEVLFDFARAVEQGGLVIATVLSTIWESGGYSDAVTRMVRERKVSLVSDEIEDYRRGAGVQARMVILRVLS
ncbi:hypothetical protein CDD83_5941 [Cordyceps sp. RAO-2017]|nr:hypothetical protein CDD83_5941 [Cordyceps sp. RAO-2017]